jgi:hypothetical protein
MKMIIFVILSFTINFCHGQYSSIVLDEDIYLNSVNSKIFFSTDLTNSELSIIKSKLDPGFNLILDSTYVDLKDIEEKIQDANSKLKSSITEKYGKEDVVTKMLIKEKGALDKFAFQIVLVKNGENISFYVNIIDVLLYPNWKQKFELISDGGATFKCYGVI